MRISTHLICPSVNVLEVGDLVYVVGYPQRYPFENRTCGPVTRFVYHRCYFVASRKDLYNIMNNVAPEDETAYLESWETLHAL